jgi:hypothetical protein
MTIKDAIFVLNCVEAHNGICNEAKETAIKSLEAWEKVKEEVIAKKNFNAEVKDAFEVGSHSRIECNTTVAVLGEVLNLIDKHLSEVSG